MHGIRDRFGRKRVAPDAGLGADAASTPVAAPVGTYTAAFNNIISTITSKDFLTSAADKFLFKKPTVAPTTTPAKGTLPGTDASGYPAAPRSLGLGGIPTTLLLAGGIGVAILLSLRKKRK